MQTKRTSKRLMEWLKFWLPSFIVGGLFASFRNEGQSDQEPRQILILLIEHLGDILISVPLIRGIRKRYGDAQITVLVSRLGFPVVEHCPYVNEIIIASPALSWLSSFKRAFQLSRILRLKKFDLAIVPKDAPNEDFNELICILGRCKRRISRATSVPKRRFKPLKFKPFYSDIVIDSEPKHELQHRLDILRLLGEREPSDALEAWLTDEDLKSADTFFLENQIQSNAPAFAFGIGASGAKRLWPLEYFAELIDKLSEVLAFYPVVIVSPAELDRAKELSALTSKRIFFSCKASVRESMALIHKCKLFIGNDSGPMHMAAAIGVPVVEISCHPKTASTAHISSPLRFGPYITNREVLQPDALDAVCAPNGCQAEYQAHCITQIKPAYVAEMATKLLRL